MPDPFPNERPTFCVTMDCGLRATRYVTCDGEGRHPYCEECADVLIRGGESDLGPVTQPRVPDFPNELVEAAAKALRPDYTHAQASDRILADESARAVLAAVLPLIPAADKRPRITHGRHCTCTPCRVEDWTNPALAPCGMHGKDCPREYQPWGAAGDPVPEAFQPGFAAVVRHAARSADAPQENPWRGPSAGHNGDAPVEFYAWQDGFAAGRSAERARLAEIDVMAFGKATCARFTYAEDQPYEAVGDRDSLRLRAFLDAYLRAALSEGTPDKEDTDA